MPLQTHTFTAGDFAYQSASNSYVLDLIVTEESVNTADNTSLIYYTLQLRSGSQNRFSGRLGANLMFNGAVIDQSGADGINIDAYYNHTYTLLSGSATVEHNSDGTLALTVQGNIWQHWTNSYAPPAMSVDGSLSLTQIARTSQVTISASTVEIGTPLTIYTNRQGKFRHTLTYSWGELSDTIATDVEDLYNWTIPDILASQIPASRDGYGNIWCNTYLGDTYIGNSSAQFWVTVPDTEKTRPNVTVTIAPVQPENVPDKMKELYIQGITQVHAMVAAEAWYSEIKGYWINVENNVFATAEMVSSPLMLSGNHSIGAAAMDLREYTGEAAAQLYVQPYRKPCVAEVSGENSVICCRCDESGVPDINGQYILLKARRSWYGLGGLNLCSMKYRFRQEYGDWGEWITLLESDTAADEYTGVLDQELEPRFAYEIEIAAEDELGQTGILQRRIPTAGTILHLGAGGRNLGFGGYCDYMHEDAIDAYWTIYMNDNRILELPDPVDAGEAAPKSYVDGRSHQEYVAVNDGAGGVNIVLPESSHRYLGVMTALGAGGHDGNLLPQLFVLETGWDAGAFRVTNIFGSRVAVSYADGTYQFSADVFGYIRVWLKLLD